MNALRLVPAVLLAVFMGTACERPSGSADPAVPADLRQTLEQLSDGLEAFDPEQVLAVYADDFISGTGRSKQGVGEVLTRLRQSKVALRVEQVDVTQADDTRAAITTSLRLRYTDRFRTIGAGEVVITDVLSHLLRKDTGRWQIYTDKRLATYREGRFGASSPNVTIEVPERLPTGLDYPGGRRRATAASDPLPRGHWQLSRRPRRAPSAGCRSAPPQGRTVGNASPPEPPGRE